MTTQQLATLADIEQDLSRHLAGLKYDLRLQELPPAVYERLTDATAALTRLRRVLAEVEREQTDTEIRGDLRKMGLL